MTSRMWFGVALTIVGCLIWGSIVGLLVPDNESLGITLSLVGGFCIGSAAVIWATR